MVQYRQAPEHFFASNSEMAMLMQTQDWTQTSLGPIETWPQSLKTSLNILFTACCPMFLVWGHDKILFYNDAYSALLNESSSFLASGQSLSRSVSPTWSSVYLAVEQVFSSGRSLQCQNQWVSADPNCKLETLIYTWSCSPLWNEVGQVGGVFATGCRVISTETILKDQVTENENGNGSLPAVETRKQTEEHLRQSEERFRLVTQAVSGLIFDWNLQTNEVYRSGKLHNLVGIDAEAAPSSADWWQGRIHPDDLARLQPQVAELFASSHSLYDSEYRVRHEEGRWVNVWEQGCLIRDEQGQVIRVVGCTVDISDRKQTELALREKEQQLQQLSDSMPQFVWICSATGQLEYVNQQWSEFSGLTLEQSQNHTLLEEFYHPDDRQLAFEQWTIALETQHPFEVEARLRRSLDGAYRWFLIRAIPGLNEQGQVVRWYGTSTDITDRKQSEAEREQLLQDLATERAQFEAVLRQMPAGVIIAQAPSGQLILGNQQAERIWRQPVVLSGEIDEYRVYQGFHSDGRLYEPEEWPLARSLTKGEVVAQEEIQFLRGDGTLGVMETSSTPIYNSQGQIISGVVIFQDISDRKQVEAALKAKSAELQHVTETAGVGLTRCSRDLRYLSVNPAYAQLTGVALEEIIGQTLVDVIGEAAFEVIRPYVERVLGGERVEYEAEVPFDKGGTRYLYVVYRPDEDSNGHIVGWIAAIIDITDRKRIEEALRTSEERLRFAVEGAALGTWEYDLASSQIVWSEQTKMMFGVPLDAEVDYEMFMHTIHPDDRDRVHATVEYAINQQEIYDIELRSVWVDGSVHWIRSIGRARYDHHGLPTRMIGVAFDITNRKQAEEDLRESERRFRRLVESNMFGVAFGDFTGGIHYVNDYFLNMVGYSREEIASKNIRWTDITPAEFLPFDEQAMIELRANGVATPFEKEYIRKDGSRVAILIGSALLQNSYDQQQEIIAFFIDLTERKQAEAEREKLLRQAQAAREEAETANRIKDEFLAVLSHELRSPLNPILGWSKLLQTRQFDEQSTRQALQTIERNAKLQTQLIDDLLDVSRILRGKMVLNIGPVNLAVVIESALETVRLAAEAKQIPIQMVIAADNVQTLGDSARLQQIVWNLLSNAVKFTPEGGQIEVKLEQVEGENIRVYESEKYESEKSRSVVLQSSRLYAQITVADTGKGIRPDFLPYVFDYFRQEDGKTTRKFGGLGLGLAIVRHMTELHGGTVQAESAGEGQGATFVVRLPLLSDGTKSAPKRVSSLTQSTDLSHLQLLIVDDEGDMRQLMQVILQQQGMQVRVAASAAEALSMLDQQLPDILISDIGMPEVDGYMLMRQIRSRSPDRGGQIPAIALTAYAGEYDQQQVLKVGFQKHVAKPVEPEELISAIVNLIKDQ